MLASCRAYVVAQSVAQNRSLVRLAERSGFGFVGSVLGDRRVAIEAERGEIVYFLIHHRLSDDTMAAIIKLLRSNASDAIRYAPIVMIIDDCPFETILKYVQFGFDDIISLPEKREIIIDRLRKQLNSEQLYIETDTYLGPDRRRMEVKPPERESRSDSTMHVRLTIERTIEHGARVVRRQFGGSKARLTQIAGGRAA